MTYPQMSAQVETYILRWVSVLQISNNSFLGVSAENSSLSLTGRKITKYSFLLSRPSLQSICFGFTCPHSHKKKTWIALVNSAMFWSRWLLHKGSFSWTHTYKAHTKKEVNACRTLNWNILQSWCHDSPLFLYTKRHSCRIEEAGGDEGTRGERRTLPPIGRRKPE